MGSAPSVSNFASYSGVLIVTVRCGAALTFGVGTSVGVAAGVVEVAVWGAVVVGEGVAAGSCFGVGGTGEK